MQSLFVGHGGLLLSLRCDGRDSRLYSEGLKRCGFELSSDDAECSGLAAFQLVQWVLGPMFWCLRLLLVQRARRVSCRIKQVGVRLQKRCVPSLSAKGQSMSFERAFLEEGTPGSLLVRALVTERQFGCLSRRRHGS